MMNNKTSLLGVVLVEHHIASTVVMNGCLEESSLLGNG